MTTLLSTGCDLSAQATAQASFDRTLTVSGPVTLSITNGSGDVVVVPGSDGSVRVVGRIRAHESPVARLGARERADRLAATPPLEQHGFTIEVGEIRDASLRNNVTIDYEITVPAATRVVSRTGSGNQTIGALAGPVEMTAGSGDLRVGPLRGDLSAATGSGDVAVKGAMGGVTVKSGSGDVLIERAEGRVTAQTASGDIVVEGRPGGDWTIGAASGDIDVRLPPDGRFTLAAATSSGGVAVTHRMDAGADQGRHQFHGSANGGGTRVTVQTASGDIHVN